MKTDKDDGARTPPMHRFWVKIEDDFLTDIRFIRMSDELLGVYVRLVLLANDDRHPGVLHASLEDIAYACHTESADMQWKLAALEELSLIYVEEGRVTIDNDRHYQGRGLNPSDAPEYLADKQRRYRQREKAAKEDAAGDSSRYGNASPTRAEQTRPDADQTTEEEHVGSKALKKEVGEVEPACDDFSLLEASWEAYARGDQDDITSSTDGLTGPADGAHGRPIAHGPHSEDLAL